MRQIFGSRMTARPWRHLVTALALVPVLAGAAGALAAPQITVDASPLNREAKAASYAPVIKKVAPSVVNIYSTKIVKVQPFFHQLDPFLRRFFGDDSDPQSPRPLTRKSQSLGSGVIVSQDGYLLTNNHVVEGADKVEVALTDGGVTYTAKVVGTDPQTDVAVLKIEPKGDLPAATLADSDRTEVGDVVLALGNPFGVGQTVTMGIVSATGRGGFGVTDYEDFIQTDAAINPGNSGGALVDAEGRLIGLNTFIVSGSGASAGVGFAIPINLCKSVMDRIITYGKVRRGYLGVSIQPVTADLAKEFHLPGENGALIGGVQPNTPAAQAGLADGDVVVEFNGKPVADYRHFRLMVAQTPPKAKATLKIIRDGREKTITATLGEQPAEMAAGGGSGAGDEPASDATALDGVEVADLDRQSRRQFDIPASVKGAVVTNVESGSAADDAGLRPGDVIVELDHKPVETSDEAAEASRKAKGDRVLLRVWSKGSDGNSGSTRYVVVENSKRK